MLRALALIWGVTLLGVLGLAPSGANAQAAGLGRTLLTHEQRLAKGPMEVRVGIEIEQITGIDQKSENYGAVASIRMEWHDPDLKAINDTNGIMIMEATDFLQATLSLGILVPGFVIRNQQGNRWFQQSKVAIDPDGTARYFERSTVTLQAPYFNFRRYPFDTQTFTFEVVSLYPEEAVQFVPLDELSGLGNRLGEEEWILENAVMLGSQHQGLSGYTSSQMALSFQGRRHIAYYSLRIFLPMVVLLAVSWATFFLGEYRKRIEVAGANLLVFVAFNWTISDGLPKLGYLTFLDFVLQCMFLVTGLIIVFNVILSRLKQNGREAFAHKLDRWVIIWVYPIGYTAVMVFAVMNYLVL